MAEGQPRIRLDPWAAEYDGAIQIGGDGGEMAPPRGDVFQGFRDE